MVKGENITFSYVFDGSEITALKDVDIEVKKGEFMAILGCNGSGKSTLAKHLNGLLPLQQGTLYVNGIDLHREEDVWRLRRSCGMVFQNPDNQFVSSVVEEDLAFGLRNYQVPKKEIPEKIKNALAQVGMEGSEKRSPHSLSGGQKQRIALAGVLTLEPELIIFDEVTSMLDPHGRRQVLALIQDLHKAGKTVIMITHFVEEAALAEKVMLMSQGQVLAWDTPRKVLCDPSLMKKAGLIPPVAVQLYYDLKAAGMELAHCPLTEEELEDLLCHSN